MITAIILAGGNSLRFGGEIPKQFTQIAGRSLLDFSVSTFNATPSIDKIIIVVPIKFKNEIKDKYPEHEIISGGKTRRESSFNGLLACPTSTEKVLIHDAARIFITQNLIEDCIKALSNADSVTLAIPAIDTIATQKHNIITQMDDRSSMISIQTPQGFHYSKICSAHKNYTGEATDDIRLMFELGYECKVIQGDENNYKITTMSDFKRSQNLLNESNEN